MLWQVKTLETTDLAQYEQDAFTKLAKAKAGAKSKPKAKAQASAKAKPKAASKVQKKTVTKPGGKPSQAKPQDFGYYGTPGPSLAALGARGTSMAVRIASSQGPKVSGSNPKTNGPSTSWPWMALRSEKPLAKGLAICIGWQRDLPKGSQMRMALCQRPR